MRRRRKIGSFCLVLHGHLPWVLSHGRWPHGEDWLFEAAAETWLPLLEVLARCAEEGIVPAWSVGMTPILLEQLAAERFRTGLVAYLTELGHRAATDRAAFVAEGRPELAPLADRWVERTSALVAVFESIGRDVAGAMRAHAEAGRIELLTSNATHGFHPLLLHDACARAQIRAGLATSERHLGVRPQGAWLPECAYRPPGPFAPVAVHGDVRWKAGVGSLFEAEGVRWFVVDSHLVRAALSEAVIEGEHVHRVGWDQRMWDQDRAWASELEPVRLWEDGRLTDVTVFGRCSQVSEIVWSGEIGFPGDGRYLEFHKRHGLRGLRYWRVTGRVGLGAKLPYVPEHAAAATREHAARFVGIVREQLQAHHAASQRYGTVCAPFDAELFGHWWAEGPEFLLEVARLMAKEPAIEATTLGARLATHPADKAVAMPEGTWGAGGDHRVWNNDELRLYWEVAYRAEDRFLELLARRPADGSCDELLSEAGRQLLLLQASDWPFVVSTRGAVDYGLRRVFDHAGLFDDLCNGVVDRLADPTAAPDLPVAEALRRSRACDAVFPDLDLAWWS